MPRSLSITRRWSIVLALIVSPAYLIPFAFVAGAVLSLSGWDDLVAIRQSQRCWFVPWVLAMALAALGAVYTFGVFPLLPSV